MAANPNNSLLKAQAHNFVESKKIKWWKKLKNLSSLTPPNFRSSGSERSRIAKSNVFPTPSASPLPTATAVNQSPKPSTFEDDYPRTMRHRSLAPSPLSITKSPLADSLVEDLKRPVDRLENGNILDGSLFVRHRSVSTLIERKSVHPSKRQLSSCLLAQDFRQSYGGNAYFDNLQFEDLAGQLSNTVESRDIFPIYADEQSETLCSKSSSLSSISLASLSCPNPCAQNDILNAVAYNSRQAIEALSHHLCKGCLFSAANDSVQGRSTHAFNDYKLPSPEYTLTKASTQPQSLVLPLPKPTPTLSPEICRHQSLRTKREDTYHVIHFTGKKHVPVKPVTDIIIAKSGRKFTRTRQESISLPSTPSSCRSIVSEYPTSDETRDYFLSPQQRKKTCDFYYGIYSNAHQIH